MGKIQDTFLRQGDYYKSMIESFLLHDIHDVLDYSYPLEKIDQYLTEKRKLMRIDLLSFLKNHKKYLYRETAEPIVIDRDFFFYNFDLQCDKAGFERILKSDKTTTTKIKSFHDLVFNNNMFYDPNEQ